MATLRRCDFCGRRHQDDAVEPVRPDIGDPRAERAGQMLWGCRGCLRKRTARLALRDRQWAELSRRRVELSRRRVAVRAGGVVAERGKRPAEEVNLSDAQPSFSQQPLFS